MIGVGSGLRFYIAKTLQAVGIADVAYALFVGVVREQSMAQEIVLTVVGVGVFSLGRLLERKLV